MLLRTKGRNGVLLGTVSDSGLLMAYPLKLPRVPAAAHQGHHERQAGLNQTGLHGSLPGNTGRSLPSCNSAITSGYALVALSWAPAELFSGRSIGSRKLFLRQSCATILPRSAYPKLRACHARLFPSSISETNICLLKAQQRTIGLFGPASFHGGVKELPQGGFPHYKK